MKIKTYKILRWIPIVNLITPMPAISIFGSGALEDGLDKVVFDYIAKHPELKDELLTEKLVSKILSEVGRNAKN